VRAAGAETSAHGRATAHRMGAWTGHPALRQIEHRNDDASRHQSPNRWLIMQDIGNPGATHSP